MATGEDFRTIALSLDGTTEVPHFQRAAFKVARIFATLSADAKDANLLLLPDEQEFKCLLAPDLFHPVPNAWGRKGWTTVVLAAAKKSDLTDVLKMAWAHALPKPKTQRKR